MYVALNEVITQCGAAGAESICKAAGAANPLDALHDFAASLASAAEAADEGPADADEMTAPAANDLDPEAAKRLHARRLFSRSIALPAEHDTPLEVLYEDDELLAVNKPTSISVHPRHRFEANSMVNRAVAHLGGRDPCVPLRPHPVPCTLYPVWAVAHLGGRDPCVPLRPWMGASPPLDGCLSALG